MLFLRQRIFCIVIYHHSGKISVTNCHGGIVFSEGFFCVREFLSSLAKAKELFMEE